MAKTGKFSKAAQESGLGKLIAEVMGAGQVRREDLGYEIDFITSPSGLNIQLYPSQRIIVKAVFGIPLDYKEAIVPVWDTLKETLLYELSETDFIHYLYNEGRCNVPDWRDIPKKGFGTTVIYAGRRGGKMLSVDEVIPTPSGWKRNGDLVAGDDIFGENGQVYQVTHAHPVEEAEAYRVCFDDGTSTYAHAEHKWRTYTDGERKILHLAMEWNGEALIGPSLPMFGGVRTTREIQAALKLSSNQGETNHAIRLAEALAIHAKSLPVDPYCLGVWLGATATAQPAIAFSGMDHDHYVSQFAMSGIKLSPQLDANCGGVVDGFHSRLSALKLLDEVLIPNDYLWSSTDQRLALLQGLMDAGGTVANDGLAKIILTDRTIASGAYQLAASLGLKPSWGDECGATYRVGWISSLRTFRLKRKYDLLPESVSACSGSNWRHITSVEPVGKMLMRCISTNNPSHLYLFGRNFNVTHNSEVVAGIGGSLLRNLLAIRNPQEYYQLAKGSQIDFTLMGTDEDSSDRLYQKLRGKVNGSPYFTPYIRDNGGGEMRFVTEADRENRDVLPSILVKAYPCTTNSARGPSNYMLALDEFQFFRSSKDSNSADLYKAATPSTSQFAPTDDPDNPDSKIIVISSPSTRIGKMYELHKTAIDEGVGSNIFTMRLSTVEMNPRIPRSKLLQDKKENPDTFKAEFGGQFLDGAGSYVPTQQFDCAIDRGRRNRESFSMDVIGRRYFWGLDLGMKIDATGLAIGHLEMVEGRGVTLIFDYIDRMMVGERFTGPGVPDALSAEKYLHVKELPVQDIVAWLFHMHQVMPCSEGMTDQHAGFHFVQLLQINGIVDMKLRQINQQINSKMYNALRGFIEAGCSRFPDVPKFEKEFGMLEASYINKYVLKVEAPSEKNAHDDMADAVAIVAMLAQEWLEQEGHLDLDPTARVLQVPPHLLPPVPMQDINGVSLRDLQLMDRMSRSTQAPARGSWSRGRVR